MKLPFQVITGLEDATRNFEAIQSTPIVDLSSVYQGVAVPSASAINAAIKNAGVTTSTAGVTIALPPGKFVMDQPINLDQTYNVTLQGAGSKYGGTQLQTKSTSDSIITARSSGGFRLRGCQLFASNSSYSGILVNLNRHPSGPIDTGLFDIRDCQFNLPPNVASTAYHITIQKAIAGTIAGNLFSGGLNAIRGLFVAGDYCNSHTIGPDNYFEASAASPVVALGAGNAVICNTFEPLWSSNDAGAYSQDASLPAYGLSFVNNRCEDAGTGGTWFRIGGQGISIAGGLFSFGNTAIATVADVHGLSVTGCQFEGSLVTALNPSIGSHSNFLVAGNNYGGTITTPITTLGTVSGRCIVDTGSSWEIVGDTVTTGDAWVNGVLRNANAANQSTSATAGTASALPATPQGYLAIKDASGTVRKVPYYNS